MYLLGKYINDLKTEDIESLIANNIRESKSLEYKKEFTIEDDKDKKRQEFLFDVTALYNSEGGCIIFGIEERKNDKGENTGYPSAFVHQNIPNKDKTELQILTLVRSNTDPSITNIVIRFFEISNNLIMIIGVPKGLGLPTMVTFNDINRFYRRTSAGKYIVATSELNQMFMQNQLIKERAQSFKEKRIEEVKEGLIIQNLNVEGALFVHLIPYGFLDDKIYDLTILNTDEHQKKLYPKRSIGHNESNALIYNLDGLLAFTYNRYQKPTSSYIQYFRNGIIEIYSTNSFTKDQQSKTSTLYAVPLIKYTIESVLNAITILKQFEIIPPYILFISINNIQNAYLVELNGITPGQFSRPNINFPPLLLTSLELDFQNLFELLKPYFDIIWQAANGEKCPPLTVFNKN